MNAWDIVVLQPMINVCIALSHFLFNNFGLTIIVITLIIRGAMWPLTMRQLRATKAMQSIQAEMAELQKKYAKDRRKLAQEQMALYKKSGMNPLGCVLPMLIQMPVWIALYQAIMRVLAVAPEDFLGLSRYLYDKWAIVFPQVPLGSQFLWLDLASPDKFMLLPILTGVSMWVQQKMSTVPSTDPRQNSQNQIMLWMMPLMFTFLSLQFPSGLALYWVTSNVVSIVSQYFVTGWGGLFTPKTGQKPPTPPPEKKKELTAPSAGTSTAAASPKTQPAREEGSDGNSRSTRQDGGGSHPAGPGGAGRGPGGGRRRRR